MGGFICLYWRKSLNIDWKIYLFIDEIQDIEYWEKTVRNYAKKQILIYILLEVIVIYYLESYLLFWLEDI